MASINTFESSESYFIIINGQKMTKKEYLKYKKQKDSEIQEKLSKREQAEIRKKERAKRKKRETEITILPETIKTMLKNAGPIRSLAAYYDNAYRQWGTIATTILNLPEIRTPFVLFRADAYDIIAIIDEISKIAKGNEKAVFSYVQKLAWKLDNTKTKMTMLYSGVCNSGVLDRFANKECINGEGRRLGLNILMTRTFKSIDNIDKCIKDLSKIAKNGLGDLEYRTDALKRSYATI